MYVVTHATYYVSILQSHSKNIDICLHLKAVQIPIPCTQWKIKTEVISKYQYD